MNVSTKTVPLNTIPLKLKMNNQCQLHQGYDGFEGYNGFEGFEGHEGYEGFDDIKVLVKLYLVELSQWKRFSGNAR